MQPLPHSEGNGTRPTSPARRPATPPSGPPHSAAGGVTRLDRVTLQLGVAVAVAIAVCSLSVSGIARQRKPSGRGWFFAGGWAWPTEPGSRWSGRSVAGTPTLTLARVATGCSSEEPAWVTAWASPHPARPEMDGRECDARVSSLISVLGPGSGDMMGDRVPATGGRGRSFYGGRPQGVCQTAPRGDRSIGEPAAPHQRSRSTQARTIADQVRRRLAARRGPTPGR
jgi:hypothetical protein